MKQNYFTLSLLMIILPVSLACNKSVDPSTNSNKPFKIYGFIVYGGYVQNGVNINANPTQIQQYLLPFGIYKVNLIYEPKLLDFPDGVKTNGIPNIRRIDSLSNLAKEDPTTLVSLDMESWNRFDKINTPPKYVQVINAFKAHNTLSQVGLYATVPQQTYGYSSSINTPAAQNKFNALNMVYSNVAATVDYFSPSLYNYGGIDSVAWKNAAAYNVKACALYGFPSKRILPYITPGVTVNGVDQMLSYNDMMLRLEYLYSLGAGGCLVWTSSSSRDADGHKLYIDVTKGWGKALVDFAAKHP